MKQIFLLFFITPLSVFSYELNEIHYREAINNKGKFLKVCGKIDSAYMHKSSNAELIFLNMGGKFPNHKFTGLIRYSSSKGNFISQPDKKYEGKFVCISGVITMYKKKPQIQIDFENQIELK
tara:strand:- start:588 stop:953 length:366 start_codon:yes stop_codon:yes gene_type:complete